MIVGWIYILDFGELDIKLLQFKLGRSIWIFFFLSLGILIVSHTLCCVLSCDFARGVEMESSSYSINSKRLFIEKHCFGPLQKRGVSMNSHTVWIFSFYRFYTDTFYSENMQFSDLGLLE